MTVSDWHTTALTGILVFVFAAMCHVRYASSHSCACAPVVWLDAITAPATKRPGW